MQMPPSFAEYVDMTAVVVHIRRNAYQQKHLYESQLSHPFCIFREGNHFLRKPCAKPYFSSDLQRNFPFPSLVKERASRKQWQIMTDWKKYNRLPLAVVRKGQAE